MSQELELNEPMSDALTDDQIRHWVAAAERREMARSGTNRPEARAVLARDLRVGYWTLTNLLRGRIKGLRASVRDKIKVGVINILEVEIRRLEHELIVVKQCGSTLSDPDILQAEACLEKARIFLKRKIEK